MFTDASDESLNKKFKFNLLSFNIRKRFSNLRKDFRLLKLMFKFSYYSYEPIN